MSPRPTIGHIRRPQMLVAAAEMIYERGFADTRTSDIAERAGVSPPNVLYHFESKDALLEQALEYASDGWFDGVREALERLESPREQVVCMLTRLLAPPHALEDYALEIETWARALHSEAVRQVAEKDTRRYLEALETVVEEGLRRGEFNADRGPDDLAMALLGLCDGFGVSVRLDLLGISEERALDIVLRSASVILGCDLLPAQTRRSADSPQAVTP